MNCSAYLLFHKSGTHTHEITISASISITVSHKDGIEPDTLLKNADSAMYLAKKEIEASMKLDIKIST